MELPFLVVVVAGFYTSATVSSSQCTGGEGRENEFKGSDVVLLKGWQSPILTLGVWRIFQFLVFND